MKTMGLMLLQDNLVSEQTGFLILINGHRREKKK